MDKDKTPELPDFDSLDDRLIAKAPSGPFIGIKTNLDPEDPEKYNPYNKQS